MAFTTDVYLGLIIYLKIKILKYYCKIKDTPFQTGGKL